MATHRHWSSTDASAKPVVTEVSEKAVAISTQPAQNFVWVLTYQTDRYEDPHVEVFPTEADAERKKYRIAMEAGDFDEEDEDEDEYVDRIFDDYAFWSITSMEVKPYNG